MSHVCWSGSCRPAGDPLQGIGVTVNIGILAGFGLRDA
jgi:hypothetical protein